MTNAAIINAWAAYAISLFCLGHPVGGGFALAMVGVLLLPDFGR